MVSDRLWYEAEMRRFANRAEAAEARIEAAEKETAWLKQTPPPRVFMEWDEPGCASITDDQGGSLAVTLSTDWEDPYNPVIPPENTALLYWLIEATAWCPRPFDPKEAE